MRILRFAVVLLLLAAAGVGTVRADTFAVLPGADAPNAPGAVQLPQALLQRPAQPEVRGPDRLELLWRAAGDTYGVPWSLLASINSVESDFGRNMGPSSAGAIGWMQFMPGTWARWGVDADGNGVADPWNPEDAIYSAARYLAASGAARGDVRRAVFSYNHATWYVDEVVNLAAALDKGGADLAFGLDRLAIRLATARADLAAASDELASARGQRVVAARATGQAATTAARAAAADRAARIAALQARVTAASRLVDQLRASAAGISFSRLGATSVAAPLLRDGYAFPVGGGAGVVSVGAGHHDYSAADIAAPAGSPVYAFTSGTVERAWRTPDARCGIGLLLRATDGRGWVYCHLSLLESGVQAGLRVVAGAPLGLVGATGEATGPHLHLQLEHADAWPQREAWFAGFAGIAFSWQDGPPAGPFAVVGGPVDVVLFHR